MAGEGDSATKPQFVSVVKDGAPVDDDSPLNVTDGVNEIDTNQESTTLLVNGPSATFTADAGTDTLTSMTHGLENGDAVVLTTTGTLPGGLDALVTGTSREKVYWVINKTTNTFQLTTFAEGTSAVNITDTGTGTHTFSERDQWEGAWSESAHTGNVTMFALGAVPFALVQVEWGDDGATQNNPATLAARATSNAHTDTTTLAGVTVTVGAEVVNNFLAPYYRIRVVNGPSDQVAIFHAGAIRNKFPYLGTTAPLLEDLNPFFVGLVTRSVLAGQDPNNEFGNLKKDGQHDANGTTTPLGVGAFSNFTADPDTDTVTSTSHGLSDGDIVVLTSTTRLPKGLTPDIPYEVTAATTNTFQLLTAPGAPGKGTLVDLVDTGIGTHSWAEPEVFRGEWIEIQGNWVKFISEARSDVAGSLFIDLSLSPEPTDGVDDDVDRGFREDITPSNIVARHTPVQARWVRHRYVNGTTAQGTLVIEGALVTNDPGLVLQALAQTPQEANLAGLVRAVLTGRNPDETFEDVPTSGPVTSASSNDLLPAGASFTSPAFSTTGFGTISIGAQCDQASADEGVYVQFADDEDFTENVITSRRETYTAEQLQELFYATWHGTLSDWARVVWENGDIGQNSFSVNVFQHTGPSEETKSPLRGPVTASTPASTARSIIFARDDDGDYSDIKQSPQGGLRVAIAEHEVEVPIKALSTWTTNQVTLNKDTATQIAGTPLANRKDFAFKNNGINEADVFIGPDSGVTESNGWPLAQFESIIIDLDDGAQTWGILASTVTGDTNTQTLNASAVNTNNGAVNPTNALTSDDSDMELDNQGDNVIYDITDLTLTLDNIDAVRIGFEGAKQASQTETVAVAQSAQGIGTSGTSVSTSTSLNEDADSYYIAFISHQTTTESVSSVTGLGLTWSLITTANKSGDVRVEAWKGEGTPTSTGAVTANFTGTVTARAINAHRLTGADKDGTPIGSAGSNTGTGTAWSATASVTTSKGIVLIGGATDSQVTSAPGGDDTELTDQNQGGGSTNRITHTSMSRAAPGSSSTPDGTWSSSSDWAAVAVAIDPGPSIDPVITLTYEVGNEGTGATTLVQTLSSATDNDFTVDVTGDRTWTVGNVDNVKVTITATTLGAAKALIDHVFVEIDESASGATQRCAFLEVAD